MNFRLLLTALKERWQTGLLPISLAYLALLWGGFITLWVLEGFLTSVAVLAMLAANFFKLDDRVEKLLYRIEELDKAQKEEEDTQKEPPYGPY